MVNVRDVRWFESEGLGLYASFESEKVRFPQLGIGIGILRPGEPSEGPRSPLSGERDGSEVRREHRSRDVRSE